MDNKDLGVAPASQPPGHQPSASAVPASQSGVPNATDRKPLTSFGVGLDRLARSVGGWPNDAVVHTIEVLNSGNDQNPQVLLEGNVPTGEKKGRPTYKGCPRTLSLKAVVRLNEYRDAFKPASGIEAATADETAPNSAGSAEGESPVGEAETPNIGREDHG